MRFRDITFGVAAAGVLFLASCASAPKSPGMPGMRMDPVGPEPTTVVEAQTDIDRWSAQLGIARAPDAAPTATAPAPSPTDQPTVPAPARPTSEPSAASVQSASGGGTEAAQDTSSQCIAPCRAIASMRRSVAALCRLAGDDDPRCVSARKTLDEGERRVARCGC